MSKRILMVDDDETILDAARFILEDLGFELETFSDPIDGERAGTTKNYDLIMLDVRMGAKNGDELTESIIRARPDAKILIMTAYPTDPLADKALSAGAFALVKKPFEIEKIIDILKV